jgi:hypothetical protein
MICEKTAIKVISFAGVIAVDPDNARRPPMYKRIITIITENES